MPGTPTHLLVEAKGIDLRKHPTHTAIPTTHQDSEGGELLEKAQPGCGQGERGWVLCEVPTRIPPRDFQDAQAGTYPKCGPPFMRSKTWAGLRNCLNLRRNLTPWLSPLLELTKARRGLEQVEGQVAFQKPAVSPNT